MALNIMKDFIITKVGWFADRPTSHDMGLSFRTLVEFLQENGLTRRTVLPDGTEVNHDSELRAVDLTDEGLSFVRSYYEKWRDGLDRGKPETDTSRLEKWLASMRKRAVG
jgi:hypothetical protein